MANWVTHLRIAEAVFNKLDLSLDFEKYLVGSIATDCGTIVYDDKGKRGYNPPRYISHWTDDIEDWDRAIHYERFYEAYIKNEKDFDKKSFYMGYFIHLITDALWIELVSRPVVESFATREEYREKGREPMRADWFNTELIFLQKNPVFQPLEILKTIKCFDNIYLDYFPPSAIQNKIEAVVKAYEGTNVEANRIFPYFTYEQYEHTVIMIIRMIRMSLLSK